MCMRSPSADRLREAFPIFAGTCATCFNRVALGTSWDGCDRTSSSIWPGMRCQKNSGSHQKTLNGSAPASKCSLRSRRTAGHDWVAAGSCAEYDWSAGECEENQTPLLPATIYGNSKHALEAILHAWSRQVALNSAWGRIFFLYGPHSILRDWWHAWCVTLCGARRRLCSEGRQLLDFMQNGGRGFRLYFPVGERSPRACEHRIG